MIEAHRYRTQARNREDARHRLFELIRAASVAPKPASRPSRPLARASGGWSTSARGRDQAHALAADED